MPFGSPAVRRRFAALAVVVALGPTAACSLLPEGDDAPAPDHQGVASAPRAQVRVNVAADEAVGVDTLVSVRAAHGRLARVAVRSEAGERVPGAMKQEGARGRPTQRLEPGTTYRVVALARNAEGDERRVTRTFRTEDLTLDEQTYASIAPLDGETVGVGMPVVVTFDIPVTDRAEVERHLHVSSSPRQAGSWYWISDTEVHWRPRTYWRAGSEVSVEADLNGVDAGNGIYGQEDRATSFTVGDRLVMKVDVGQHTMRVVRNGELVRTLPISAGKPGFETRSGTKVILEKFRRKTMDAATTGIDEDDPEYYNIEDVEYAQRVTWSGEFLHAAPWSVGSQGSANVSHGCVGMSTEDAGWLYWQTRRGDVVEVVGSERRMELTNGFGDWNLSWADYREGSAL